MESTFPLPSEFPNYHLYTPGNDNAEISVQRVDIPEDARWLYFLLGGCGGNGAAGFSKASGSTGRGGGGGASSSLAIGLAINSLFFPKTLYAYLAGPGSSWYSFLSLTPRMGSGVTIGSNYFKSLMTSAPGTPGGAGGSASGGAGGSGSSGIFANSLQTMLMARSELTGNNGGAGGTQTGADGAVSESRLVNSNFLTGGGGGAGCQSADFLGGDIIGIGHFPTIKGGQSPGNDGGGGLMQLSRYGPLFTGGAGGASNHTGTGGKGGRGGPGCGGGGGGSGVTGGAGGPGGSGFLLFGWGT